MPLPATAVAGRRQAPWSVPLPSRTVRDAALDALALLFPSSARDAARPTGRCAPAAGPPSGPSRAAGGCPTARRSARGSPTTGVVRAVLLAFKEQGRRRLARCPRAGARRRGRRGRGLRRPDGAELCAVPESRRARRRRGFDPVGGAAGARRPRRARVFAPARPHAAQKSLAVDERARNLDDVFRSPPPVAGRRFLLVDDVVTTGATLAAAVAALRAAGAEVVAAAVVAATRSASDLLWRLRGNAQRSFRDIPGWRDYGGRKATRNRLTRTASAG